MLKQKTSDCKNLICIFKSPGRKKPPAATPGGPVFPWAVSDTGQHGVLPAYDSIYFKLLIDQILTFCDQKSYGSWVLFSTPKDYPQGPRTPQVRKFFIVCLSGISSTCIPNINFLSPKLSILGPKGYFWEKIGYSRPFLACRRVTTFPKLSGTLLNQISISILTCLTILRPLSPLSQYFLFTTRLYVFHQCGAEQIQTIIVPSLRFDFCTQLRL